MSTLSANSNVSLPNLMFIFLLSFGFTLKLLGPGPGCAQVFVKDFIYLSNIFGCLPYQSKRNQSGIKAESKRNQSGIKGESKGIKGNQ